MEMENPVVRNGNVVNLPIGFRFQPTDEELVVHYLKRKVFSLPLPVSVIPDSEVFQLNPWDLPGNLKDKRYFFSQKKMNLMNKSNGNLSTDCGYWKCKNRVKQIFAPASNLVIGLRKSHVFYKREKARGLKTQWILQEFCLVGSVTTPYSTQKLMMQLGDWVVCRVFERKMKATRNRKSQTTSCSSGITEVSSNELDEEASSCPPRH